MVSEEQGGTGEQWQDTDDWHLNAILPHAQMASSEMGYIYGYEQAVGALTAAAYQTAAGHSEVWPGTYVMVDTILFPLVFSARHYLELSLKRIIRRARVIGRAKGKTTPPTHHILAELYQDAVRAVAEHAPRSLSFVEKLEGPVAEFQALDPQGDAMRYAGSKSDDLHLADVRMINIGRFQAWFDHLSLLVGDAFLALGYDEEELDSGTATKDYDRSELFALAKRLPPCDEWNNQTLLPFLEEEMAARAPFSKNRFEAALDRIRTRPWLSILVGLELPLPELSGDLFRRLASGEKSASITDEEWGALYCLHRVGGGMPLESYGDQLKRAKEGKEAMKSLEAQQESKRDGAEGGEISDGQPAPRSDPMMVFHQDSMAIYHSEGKVRAVLSSHAFTFCRGLERLGQPTLLKAFREGCDEVGLNWGEPPPKPPRDWPRIPFSSFKRKKTGNSEEDE